MPSHAEITDAAIAERAECVMLNKGPYVVEAVRTLDNILVRMQAHQEKKRTMLRELALASRFLKAICQRIFSRRPRKSATCGRPIRRRVSLCQ